MDSTTWTLEQITILKAKISDIYVLAGTNQFYGFLCILPFQSIQLSSMQFLQVWNRAEHSSSTSSRWHQLCITPTNCSLYHMYQLQDINLKWTKVSSLNSISGSSLEFLCYWALRSGRCFLVSSWCSGLEHFHLKIFPFVKETADVSGTIFLVKDCSHFWGTSPIDMGPIS